MKYKEFKTGDYIKAQEDGSLYIVGNKKNIVAAVYNDEYHLFDSATDYINYNYKTNEVIGDFEYCSDKEIEIINNEMKGQRCVFVKEWGVCVPEFVLNFKPHDVLRSLCGNQGEYIILKNIEVSVDDGVPTFKIKPYLYIESGYRYYYEDVSPSFYKDDLEYDADMISLYGLIDIDEMLHKFYLYDIHYNEEKDSYEYTSYEEEIYDELYDEDDDCSVDSIDDIKSIFDAKMYIENHIIDDNLKKFLNCEQLSDYELEVLLDYCDSFKTIKFIKEHSNIREYYDSEVKSHERIYDIEYDKERWFHDVENNFLGVGISVTRSILKKIIAEEPDNVIVRLISYFLETEYFNIKAKVEDNMYYENKQKCIRNIIDLLEKNKVLVYGIQKCDDCGFNVSHIIYFELPDGSQISFHNYFYSNEAKKLPKYFKDWDGIKYSTFDKLEKFIKENYDIDKWKDIVLKEKEQKRLMKLEKKKKKQEERMKDKDNSSDVENKN